MQDKIKRMRKQQKYNKYQDPPEGNKKEVYEQKSRSDLINENIYLRWKVHGLKIYCDNINESNDVLTKKFEEYHGYIVNTYLSPEITKLNDEIAKLNSQINKLTSESKPDNELLTVESLDNKKIKNKVVILQKTNIVNELVEKVNNNFEKQKLDNQTEQNFEKQKLDKQIEQKLEKLEQKIEKQKQKLEKQKLEQQAKEQQIKELTNTNENYKNILNILDKQGSKQMTIKKISDLETKNKKLNSQVSSINEQLKKLEMEKNMLLIGCCCLAIILVIVSILSFIL